MHGTLLHVQDYIVTIMNMFIELMIQACAEER